MRPGVDRVVFVPPSLDGFRNNLALAAAQAHPDRFAVMDKIDIKDPQATTLTCSLPYPRKRGCVQRESANLTPLYLLSLPQNT
jgi:hypothetical protein